MKSRIRTRALALTVAAMVACAATGAWAVPMAFSPADVYRTAARSVVFIFGTNSGRAGSSGTGTVISTDGLILTNNHVIADDATDRPYKTLEVYFKPDPTTGDVKQDLRKGYPAQVVARDKDLDLAVIRVPSVPSTSSPIVFGRSGGVEVGQQVAAIGHPQGGGLWTLTTGTISSSRTLGAKPVFQSQASLNPGNSGGPLLDGAANLIGVNTAIIRSTNSGVTTEGLNFSVKSDTAVDWLGGQGIRVQVARLEAPATPTTPPREPKPEPRRMAEAAPPVPEKAAPPVTEPAEPPLAERREPAEPPVAERREERTEPAEPARPGREEGGEPREHAQPKQPQRFEGPNGEEMFGVPDDDFDLESVEQDLIARVRAKAQKAFDELDELDDF